MFYPPIKRRAKYKQTRSGQYYADYSQYYSEISEDCQFRCVYCDVLLKENGGEGMHLDHFRPQKHFPDLAKTPENLLLACAKCNQLKSDFWPDEKVSDSHFIDPFCIIRSNHFSVLTTGEVLGISKQSQYMIDLLLINRLSRKAIRRMRNVKSSANNILQHVELELGRFSANPAQISSDRLSILCKALSEVREMLAEL
ncbi:HNH endonuclease [Pseudomonas baetica]|uniref:HNH endonuclease n=1 Tax=Pseudomonas baetica TaxID=674054 RepID=UPI003EF036FC